MNKTKKQITKYRSQAELIEELIRWYGIAEKIDLREKYLANFDKIYTRLTQYDYNKLELANFVQKNALTRAEVFILLRVLILQVLKVFAPSYYKVTTLLQESEPFGERIERLAILVDGQSALFSEGILAISNATIEIKYNFLLKRPKKASITKKRTFNPKRVLAELNKYVIGQDEAKKQVVAGVFEHLIKCARAKNGQTFHKSNIFISGPTGSGKSYMCQCLAKILNISFVHADASQYTQTGYYGMSVSDSLKPLLPLAKDGKLPVSIVFLDELDKLHKGSEREGGATSTNVQAEILRLIESTHYLIENRFLSGKSVNGVDISQVLFIAGGAFEGLQIKHTRKSVGFTQGPIVSPRTLTADDYIGYGMMPELIGRFSYFVQLKGLEKEDLRQILLNPHNGPLQQYKELLHTSTRVLPTIVEDILTSACERHLGARGLHQQVGQLFQEAFLENKVQIEI